MNRLTRTLGFAALAACAPLALAAQATPLNVKLGLWEMTVQINMPGGMPPGVDTSKMPPEQRAKMEAQMQAMMGGRGGMPPTVTKSCVTKEDVDQARLQKDPPNSSCTSKITTATATLVEMTQTCTGAMAGTREARIEASSPTAMKMTSKSVSGLGAGTTVTINGKWISADCGTVK